MTWMGYPPHIKKPKIFQTYQPRIARVGLEKSNESQ